MRIHQATKRDFSRNYPPQALCVRLSFGILLFRRIFVKSPSFLFHLFFIDYFLRYILPFDFCYGRIPIYGGINNETNHQRLCSRARARG